MSEGHLGELTSESKPAIQVVEPDPADSPIVPSSERCEKSEETKEQNTSESTVTLKQ